MNTDYRQILKREFYRRQNLRPSYSLRAFARDLKVPAPQLSAIFAGKKGLSQAKAATIAQALKFSEPETIQFVNSVAFLHARSQGEKDTALQKIKKIEKELGRGFRTLQEAQFQVVADWYHAALHQLIDTVGFKWTLNFISERLGISSAESRNAISALEKVGVLKRNGKNYHKVDEALQTPNVPSRAIRMNHLQLLKKAASAVEEQSIEERDISSLTIAIDRRRMPEFKQRLREFRDEFCELAGQGSEKNEIYILGLQFFRISQPESERDPS